MKPAWQKKLTKAEINHIKDTTDSGTLAQFKRNRKQHRHDISHGMEEPCLECRIIAVKLCLE